ncbi:ATP-binding protein [Streptomyces sp. NBC_01198]|uniref:ATP-binding protein n=1 Tax=Streptomyces sp. NBC_01198 TaxID=2903769 RepID=UPI002E12BEED|nr:ATP-binding protein [Streptomyces sp. NBC_01198]
MAAQSRLELACEPSAPRRARAHAKDVLPGWGLPQGLVDDALLIVSELATNAVRHAGAPAVPDSPLHGPLRVPLCCLTLLLVADHLYISFYDEACNRPPVLRRAPDDAESGRGVALVDGLTGGAWGWQPSSGKPGKFVWAQLNFVLSDPQRAEKLRSLGVSA